MLKLKLQYFGHLMWRVDSLEKTLMLGRIGGRRRRGRQRMRWLDGITDSMDMSQWTLGVGDGQRGLACCDSWGRKESDTTERLNWTELNSEFILSWGPTFYIISNESDILSLIFTLVFYFPACQNKDQGRERTPPTHTPADLIPDWGTKILPATKLKKKYFPKYSTWTTAVDNI